MVSFFLRPLAAAFEGGWLMNYCPRRAMVLLGILLVLALFAPTTMAQITGVVSSDVEAFFGSQSDTFNWLSLP